MTKKLFIILFINFLIFYNLYADENIIIVDNTIPEKITINGYYKAYWNEKENRNIYIETNETKPDVPFNEYIMGVVFVEMAQTSHGDKIGLYYSNALKAQAIAAINKALKKMKDGKISGKENVQAYKDQPYEQGIQLNYEPEIIDAVNEIINQAANIGKVMKFNNEIFETFFFSGDTTFTRNSEDWDSWYYSIIHRANKSGPNVIGNLLTDRHCVGMNQYGAIEMEDENPNITYEQILKYYYHPSPPFVKYIKLLQSGKKIYEAGWSDLIFENNLVKRVLNSPLPNSETGFIAIPDAKIDVEMWFSEKVISAKDNFLRIKVKIGEQEINGLATEINKRPSEKWQGVIQPGLLKQLPFGEIVIKIEAVHEYVTNFELDKNSATVSFNGLEGSNVYEKGVDINHRIKLYPKDSISFRSNFAPNQYQYVRITNPQQSPTPALSEGQLPEYPSAYPTATVAVDAFVKGLMLGMTGGSDFSNAKYKEGYKAIGVAAYTLLLNEVEKNKSRTYDILVNGYSDGQKYYIPYMDFGNTWTAQSIKNAIEAAYN